MSRILEFGVDERGVQAGGRGSGTSRYADSEAGEQNRSGGGRAIEEGDEEGGVDDEGEWPMRTRGQFGESISLVEKRDTRIDDAQAQDPGILQTGVRNVMSIIIIRHRSGTGGR